MVTAKEVDQLRSAFRQIDRNDDGKLEFDDLVILLAASTGKQEVSDVLFQSTFHCHAVLNQEAESKAKLLLRVLDSNKDGVVSWDEFFSAAQQGYMDGVSLYFESYDLIKSIFAQTFLLIAALC